MKNNRKLLICSLGGICLLVVLLRKLSVAPTTLLDPVLSGPIPTSIAPPPPNRGFSSMQSSHLVASKLDFGSIISEPDPGIRHEKFLKWLRQLERAELYAASRQMWQAMQAGQISSAQEEAFLRRVGQIAGADCLRHDLFGEGTTPPVTFSNARTVLQGWASSAPSEALAFFRSRFNELTASQQIDLARGLIVGSAEQGTPTLFATLDQLPSSSLEALAAPNTMAELAASARQDPIELLLQNIERFPDPIREAVTISAFQAKLQLPGGTSLAAQALINGDPLRFESVQLVELVSKAMVSHDPTRLEAFAWLMRFPNDTPALPIALRSVMNTVPDEDVSIVATWILGQPPSPPVRAVAAALSERIRNLDSEASAAWLNYAEGRRTNPPPPGRQ